MHKHLYDHVKGRCLKENNMKMDMRKIGYVKWTPLDQNAVKWQEDMIINYQTAYKQISLSWITINPPVTWHNSSINKLNDYELNDHVLISATGVTVFSSAPHPEWFCGSSHPLYNMLFRLVPTRMWLPVERIHTVHIYLPSPCIHSITTQRPQLIIGICIL